MAQGELRNLVNLYLDRTFHWLTQLEARHSDAFQSVKASFRVEDEIPEPFVHYGYLDTHKLSASTKPNYNLQ